jgi:copper chaperone CopZ
MSDHTYKFNVAMSCGGCSGAVDRVLKKLEGMPPAFHTLPVARTLLHASRTVFVSSVVQDIG